MNGHVWGHDGQRHHGGLESEGKMIGLVGGQNFVYFALVAHKHFLFLFMLLSLSIPFTTLLTLPSLHM